MGECIKLKRSTMKHSTILSTDFEQLTMWDEIQDMPGEIFDIKEEDLMAVFDDTISEDLDRETKKLLDQF
jgi:hypothetical protein